MPLPEIDFRRIRPHRGSQHHGFEELCCQIASLEPRSASDVFYRKGLGADAGVECFVRHVAGHETGWQAKWFFMFGDNQVAQLDKSIRQALAKHPRLKNYIVCLPIDLRDARRGRGRSELERWRAWARKWEGRARRHGQSVSIELWGATLLAQRLTKNSPLYAGRVRYWFDDTCLDEEWFRQRFAESRASLGERYVPETNVDLPIRRSLLAFGRDQVVQAEIEDWSRRLEEARYRAIDSLDRRVSSDEKNTVRALQTATDKLADLISQTPLDPDAVLPVADWRDETERALTTIHPCIRALQDSVPADDRYSTDPKQYAIHSLHRLSDLLHEFRYTLEDERWRLINNRRILVTGEAGVGKSHLLGDIAEHCIREAQPAVLLLGSSFTDGEPWFANPRPARPTKLGPRHVSSCTGFCRASGGHACPADDRRHQRAQRARCLARPSRGFPAIHRAIPAHRLRSRAGRAICRFSSIQSMTAPCLG